LANRKLADLSLISSNPFNLMPTYEQNRNRSMLLFEIGMHFFRCWSWSLESNIKIETKNDASVNYEFDVTKPVA